MRVLACVSIDTEADHDARWIKGDPLTFRSVVDGIPDVLTPIFRPLGVRPTYLVTTEVMDDPASVAVLERIVDGEIGTHLHGDHVAPECRVPARGAASYDYTCYYAEEIEHAKIRTITNQFRDRFGRSPLSYRAGRYAASAATIRSLANLGYRVDTSVTPGVLWINDLDSSQRLDFRNAPRQPYRPSTQDLTDKGDSPLLEVPITIVPPPRPFALAMSVGQRALGRPVRSYPLWLRPSTTPLVWIPWILERTFEGALGRNTLVFNVMMHSMEISLGASPHSTTSRAVRTVIRRLYAMLLALKAIGARFVTLEELAGTLSP